MGYKDQNHQFFLAVSLLDHVHECMVTLLAVVNGAELPTTDGFWFVATLTIGCHITVYRVHKWELLHDIWSAIPSIVSPKWFRKCLLICLINRNSVCHRLHVRGGTANARAHGTGSAAEPFRMPCETTNTICQKARWLYLPATGSADKLAERYVWQVVMSILEYV